MPPVRRQFLSQLGPAPASATLQVVYLGLFPTTLGFTTWAYALARTTSGRMGATIYAVPTLVILMSWLILGQVPRWLAVAGGAICLARGRRIAIPLTSRPESLPSQQKRRPSSARRRIDTLERNL